MFAAAAPAVPVCGNQYTNAEHWPATKHQQFKVPPQFLRHGQKQDISNHEPHKLLLCSWLN